MNVADNNPEANEVIASRPKNDGSKLRKLAAILFFMRIFKLAEEIVLVRGTGFK